MAEPKTNADVLALIQSSHEEMEALLASLSHERLTLAESDTGWAIKDHLVHITEWEKMTMGWIASSLRGEDVKRFAPGFEGEDEATMNRLNDHIFQQNRTRALDDVLGDFRATHERIAESVKPLSAADLFDPQRFAWRKGSPFINLIAGNTYEHYAEHSGWIRERLDKDKG